MKSSRRSRKTRTSQKRRSYTKRTSRKRKSRSRKRTSRKRTSRTRKSRSRKRRSRSKVRIPLTEKGGLYGYHVDLSAKRRRSILRRLLSKRKATYSEIVKRLNVLVIYNKRRHPETSNKIKRDIDYVHRHFQKYSLTLLHKTTKRRSKKKSIRR
jgi:septum formation topological specificity factor MinE